MLAESILKSVIFSFPRPHHTQGALPAIKKMVTEQNILIVFRSFTIRGVVILL